MTIVEGNTDAQARYTRVAMWLHWLIALAIIYNLASGLLRPVLPRAFFVFHVSSGITILALTVVRVGWRLTYKPPPFLPMQRWELRLAHAVHFLLYCAMVALPLSGWAMVSARPPMGSPGAAVANAGKPPSAGARGPTMVWGVAKLPLIAPINEMGRTADGAMRQHALRERIELLHLDGGWILLALLLLHVGGALKHQFIDRRRELARMGLGRSAAR